MNERNTTGIVLIGAFVVALGGYQLLPSLQDSARSSTTEASEHVERARRLLERYAPALVHNDSLLSVIGSTLDLDVTSRESMTESAQDLFEEMVEAYESQEGAVGRPGSLDEGIRDRAALLAGNEKYLAEALAAAGEALAAAPNHPEAHRVKGAILYHQATTKLIRSAAIRNQAMAPAGELVALATQIRELEKGGSSLQASGADANIADRQARIAESETALARDRADLAAAEARVTQLEQQLAAAQERAASARAQLDALRDKGVDFSNPDGANAYADAYTRTDQDYRAALREVQAIERGSLPNAQIDRTGDFLTGSYLENGAKDGFTVDHGLEHHRSNRAIIRIALEGREKDLEALRADVTALQAMRARHEAADVENAKALAAAKERAKVAYEAMTTVLAEADEMEAAALATLGQSAAASQTAATNGDQRVRDATTRVAKVSPAAVPLSAYEAGRRAGWVTGYAKAQAADAQLAQAWVHYRQVRAHRQLATLLERDAKTLGLGDVDFAAENTAADEAKAAGIAALATSMKTLQAAHREAGQPWTITAQAAGAMYLAVLLEAPHADAYLQDTLEAYRTALAGREDEPFAVKFQERLAQLENR